MLTPKALYATTVQFDYQPDAEDVWFDCWTDGERWNGWAMPYLTAEQAHKLCEFLRTRFHQDAEYDEEHDVFMTVVSDDPIDGMNYWTPLDYSPGDGTVLHLYPIGTGAWTWIDASDVE